MAKYMLTKVTLEHNDDEIIIIMRLVIWCQRILVHGIRYCVKEYMTSRIRDHRNDRSVWKHGLREGRRKRKSHQLLPVLFLDHPLYS